jgi:hypothetical protein
VSAPRGSSDAAWSRRVRLVSAHIGCERVEITPAYQTLSGREYGVAVICWDCGDTVALTDPEPAPASDRPDEAQS